MLRLWFNVLVFQRDKLSEELAVQWDFAGPLEAAQAVAGLLAKESRIMHPRVAQISTTLPMPSFKEGYGEDTRLVIEEIREVSYDPEKGNERPSVGHDSRCPGAPCVCD